MFWIKHFVKKAFAEGASAIIQIWNLGHVHRLTLIEGRIDDSKSPFLNGLYLIIKVHREVVVPRFTCILENRSNTCAVNLDEDVNWNGINFQ